MRKRGFEPLPFQNRFLTYRVYQFHHLRKIQRKANSMSKRSWTIQNLEYAVKNSVSMRETLSCLRLHPTGGNYNNIRKHINQNNFDTSHWLGQAANKGKRFPKEPLPLNKILVKNSFYSRNNLKKRLIKDQLLDNTKCNQCSIPPIWNDKALVFEIDHINGVFNDNRIENLQLVCPNCHSQFPTSHGNRNRKMPPNHCIDCGIEIHHRSKRCCICASKVREKQKRKKKEEKANSFCSCGTQITIGSLHCTPCHIQNLHKNQIGKLKLTGLQVQF